MSSQSSGLHRSVHVLVALTLTSVLASSLAPAAAAAAPGAPAPAELRLNTTVRHAAIEPEPGAVAAARFRVEIPQAGLLVLDLTAAAGAQPVLRLLGLPPAAGGRAGGAARWVAQTPAALLVAAQDAAVLVVEVAALEPDQSLPAFKLRSAFAAADAAEDDPGDDAVDPWDDDLPGRKPPLEGSGGGGAL